MKLYAQAHSKYKSTVRRLKAYLDGYFNHHDVLCLSVKKDRLQVDDAVVYPGDAKEGDLAFALFRDGVLSLYFLVGIEIARSQFPDPEPAETGPYPGTGFRIERPPPI